MRRRNFTSKERAALYVAADGKSDLSGNPLGDSFHADHLVPFAANGKTDVANGQVLLPEENIMKSGRHVELRSWQKDFVDLVITARSKRQVDFLLSAPPGAGKTIASMSAVELFLQEYPGGKLIIVVPSVNLRDQWQDGAWKLFGISLQTKEWNGAIKADYCGAVTTYQTIGNNSLTFRSIVSRQPTMVIFDEIHHAGDDKLWGDAIRNAFENATFRLSLSGTPFRTDGAMIPFLKYDDQGYCVADFTYGYIDAIKHSVLRVISFHNHTGEVEYLRNGEHISGSIHSEADPEEVKAHLRRLLDSEGRWVQTLIKKANERLLSLRQYKENAAGLILCIDQHHALQVAKAVRSVTGIIPDLIISNDERATSSVNSFRDSKNHWIVAVRQVSEGVDIKRLMVLCYLTTTATELFFRQAIGRIARNEGTEFDEEAYCFMPDHPELVKFAMRIMEEQVQAMKEQEEASEKEEKGKEDREQERIDIELLGTSDAELAGLILGGETYRTNDAKTIMSLAHQVNVPEVKVAQLIKLLSLNHKEPPRPEQPEEVIPKTNPAASDPPEVRAGKMRSKIKASVNRLSKITGREHKDIHSEYFRKFGVAQADMNIQQLKDKIQWLENQIQTARQVRR